MTIPKSNKLEKVKQMYRLAYTTLIVFEGKKLVTKRGFSSDHDRHRNFPLYRGL